MTANGGGASGLTGIAAGMGIRGPLARPEQGVIDWPPAIAPEREAPVRRLLGNLYRALVRDDPIAHRYLLLLRFILANAVALALLGADVGQGWVGALLAADEAGLCVVISAVLLAGLVWSAQRALELSRALNDVERLQAFPGASVPGRHADATGLNYESAYSRGIVPGEYTVNLHLYRNPSSTYPIPATVVTSVKGSSGQSARQLLASEVQLAEEGEELTVYRFELRENGDLVAGSVHSLSKPLRTWRGS